MINHLRVLQQCRFLSFSVQLLLEVVFGFLETITDYSLTFLCSSVPAASQVFTQINTKNSYLA